MRTSLKYKFLVTLLGVPLVALSLYFMIAKNLFHRDKIMYTMNALETNANNVGQILDFQISQLRNYLTLAPDVTSEVALKMITEEYSYLEMLKISGRLDWARPDLEQNKEGPSTFRSEAKKISMLAKNTIIPLSNEYVVYLFDHKGSTFSLLINFQKTLVNARKNDLFNIQFYNPLVAQWNQKGRRISETLLERIKKSESDHTLTLVIDSEKDLEAAYKTRYGLYVIASVTKDAALVVLDELYSKSFYYFLLFIGISGVLSVLITNKLTSGLQQLQLATMKVSEGKYDLALTIKSNDEVGTLATSFQLMSTKIGQLLAELRRYNEQLEEMVKERTRDLNQALSLQRAMIDSFDEGFFIIDDTGTVGELRSHATQKIFGKDIQSESLATILELNENPKEFAEFCSVIFSGQLPYEDAIQLLPNSVLTREQKLLQVKYSKITELNKSSDLLKNIVQGSDQISQLVCVVSDKTDEYHMQLKLKAEREYVQVILNIVNDPQNFREFAANFAGLMEELKQNTKDFTSELYRKIHTYKAHASYLGLKELAEQIHKLESEYKACLDQGGDLQTYIDQLCLVDAEFRSRLKKVQSLSGVNERGEVEALAYKISDSALRKVVKQIEALTVDQQQKAELASELFATPLQEVLSSYRLEIDRLATELNRPAMLLVTGEAVQIYRPVYQAVFDQLIHLLRNSMDHGYNGQHIELTMDVRARDSIVLHYSDNGPGINLAKLRSKMESKGHTFQSDEELAQAVFMDEVSTADSVGMLSGRGVGMGALKAAVEGVGGSIRVKARGPGFNCKIQLPMLQSQEIFKLVRERYLGQGQGN